MTIYKSLTFQSSAPEIPMPPLSPVDRPAAVLLALELLVRVQASSSSWHFDTVRRSGGPDLITTKENSSHLVPGTLSASMQQPWRHATWKGNQLAERLVYCIKLKPWARRDLTSLVHESPNELRGYRAIWGRGFSGKV